MNNTSIESLAISAVMSSIASTKTLQPSILSNDREPSWDGFVYLYENSKHIKENMVGRVPVQVKGKLVIEIPKDEISFSAEVSDLNNYKNDKGIIYFVVCINKNQTAEKKIFYKTLTSIEIAILLKDIKNKKHKAIRLKKFPKNSSSKSTIFHNFHIDSTKQLSFKNSTPLRFEDILNDKSIKKITASGIFFSPTNKKNIRIEDVILEQKPFFYAIKEGVSIPIPIENYKDISFISTLESPIIINNKKYFNYIKTVESKYEMQFLMGDSMKILYCKKESKFTKVSFTPSSSLKNRIKDLSFLIQISEERKIKFKNIEIPFFIDKIPDFNIKSIKDDLLVLVSVQKDLKVLNVKDDLILDEIINNTSAWKEFKLILDSVIRGKHVKLSVKSQKSNQLIMKSISNINLLLFCEKTEDKTSLYKLYSFLEIKNLLIKLTYIADKNIEHIATPFSASISTLTTEDFLKISNINYSKILQDYKDVLHINPKIYEVANIDLLYLLNAYDKSLGQKKELLEVAEKIAKWILEEDDKMPLEMKQINYLQVIKRRRLLNKEEYKVLINIVEDSSAEKQLKVASYLLLDNQISAESHFVELDKTSQNLFKEYPVYRFWENV